MFNILDKLLNAARYGELSFKEFRRSEIPAVFDLFCSRVLNHILKIKTVYKVDLESPLH